MAYKTVFLLSCSQKKANSTTQAENLYQGAYFKKALEYAKHKNGDILVLSAKYHVLKLNDIVAPYDLTLTKMPTKECREWTNIVRKQLMECQLKRDIHTTNSEDLVWQFWNNTIAENVKKECLTTA